MGIDWENFEFLEKFLKKQSALKNETIERTAILLNLDNPKNLWEVKRKIRKVKAFNEYLMFRELREKGHQEDCLVIKSPKDLLYKIESLNGKNPLLKNRMIANYHEFNKLLAYPSHRKWDIVPVFTSMAENCGLIEYKKTKDGYLYSLSHEGGRIKTNLIQGLGKYGILEFCLDKEEYRYFNH